jgi:hypothetical protein
VLTFFACFELCNLQLRRAGVTFICRLRLAGWLLPNRRRPSFEGTRSGNLRHLLHQRLKRPDTWQRSRFARPGDARGRIRRRAGALRNALGDRGLAVNQRRRRRRGDRQFRYLLNASERLGRGLALRHGKNRPHDWVNPALRAQR